MTREEMDVPMPFAPCPDCHERDGRHLAGCPSDESGELAGEIAQYEQYLEESRQLITDLPVLATIHAMQRSRR